MWKRKTAQDVGGVNAWAAISQSLLGDGHIGAHRTKILLWWSRCVLNLLCVLACLHLAIEGKGLDPVRALVWRAVEANSSIVFWM